MRKCKLHEARALFSSHSKWKWWVRGKRESWRKLMHLGVALCPLCGLNSDRIRVPRGWRCVFWLSYLETRASVISLIFLILQWNGSCETYTQRMRGRGEGMAERWRNGREVQEGNPTFLVQSTMGQRSVRKRQPSLLVVRTHWWMCRILGQHGRPCSMDHAARDWEKTYL